MLRKIDFQEWETIELSPSDKIDGLSCLHARVLDLTPNAPPPYQVQALNPSWVRWQDGKLPVLTSCLSCKAGGHDQDKPCAAKVRGWTASACKVMRERESPATTQRRILGQFRNMV